jgi:hypothetical protein
MNGESRRIVATRVTLARTSAERRRGLKSRTELDEYSGLWITPCEAIHTFGMKFPIDALFLDKRRCIRKIRRHLAPCRIALCLSAESVLELAAGTANQWMLAVGDQLDLSANQRAI